MLGHSLVEVIEVMCTCNSNSPGRQLVNCSEVLWLRVEAVKNPFGPKDVSCLEESPKSEGNCSLFDMKG